MKLNFPIEISMEDFVKKGKFDCIQIGQSKEWIINNFPDPDYGYSMSYKDTIWCYGSFQFFFAKNQLASIFCENLALDVPESLKIDKWIFNLPVTLLKFIEILNNDYVDFNLEHHNPKHGLSSRVTITIASSKVKLDFYDVTGSERDCNSLRFHAISL